MNALPASWDSKTLPALATVFTDGPFGSNLKSAHYKPEGVRVIRLQNVGVGKLINDDVAFISREHFESLPRNHCRPGDVIVGTLGEPNLRACVIPPDVPEALNKADCLLLRVDPEVADRDYICAVLNSDEIVERAKSLVRGQTRGRISMGRLKGLQIPLPPLAEQKRIAGLLDAADALRAKRRESLAQLDALLQSTFLHLFGDPVTNPMGWEVENLDSWLDNIDSGWSPKCLDRPAADDGEWGVLKLGSVTWCEFDDSEQKALPQDLKPRPEIEVKKGDLLFARKNTYDLVAAAAYVHDVRPRLMLPDLIFRLRINDSAEIEPTFLWQLLIEPHQRQHIQSLAGGAAGSMPNISKAKLRGVKLIRPPLSLQHRFARIVESVERQKARLRGHLAELDALFASLQHRAFRGDL